MRQPEHRARISQLWVQSPFSSFLAMDKRKSGPFSGPVVSSTEQQQRFLGHRNAVDSSVTLLFPAIALSQGWPALLCVVQKRLGEASEVTPRGSREALLY